MDDDAFQSYADETESWLKRGRSRLVKAMLGRHIGEPDGTMQMLEIGAGVGQNVRALARYGPVDCVEVSELGLAALRCRDDVRHIYDRPVPVALKRRYDVIGAFDVLEHLEDDSGVVRWTFDNLNPGGWFIATVPAYPWLFSWHDVALHHHRRYTHHGLIRLVEPHGILLQQGYFVSSLFPMAVATRLRSVISYRRSHGRHRPSAKKQSGKMSGTVDRLLLSVLAGEVALIGRGFRFPAGLSAFVVARKPQVGVQDSQRGRES